MSPDDIYTNMREVLEEALGVDEELGGEVPSHVAGVLLLEELPHRVGLAAVDVDLGHHVDADAAEVELVLDELLNLGLAAGFLPPELVAREAHNLREEREGRGGSSQHLGQVRSGQVSTARRLGTDDDEKCFGELRRARVGSYRAMDVPRVPWD